MLGMLQCAGGDAIDGMQRMADDMADARLLRHFRQGGDGGIDGLARYRFLIEQARGDRIQCRADALQQRQAVTFELAQQVVGGADGFARSRVPSNSNSLMT